MDTLDVILALTTWLIFLIVVLLIFYGSKN